MLIDWFTVIAQIINFLILVALLKQFLYDRIIRAMDEREAKIRSRLEAAQKKEKESEGEAEKYRKKSEEIEEKRKDMLQQAKVEAEEQRKELTQKARQETEALRARWQEAVQREKDTFLRDLRQLAGRQVYAVCRRVLKDLADTDLEERVVKVFVKELECVKTEVRDKLAAAIRADGKKATVRSGFEISNAQRREVTRALHEHISAEADVRYKTDSKMILGLEVKSRGEKLDWSFEGYLKTLEQETRAALEGGVRHKA